jgi:hypothetical protein
MVNMSSCQKDVIDFWKKVEVLMIRYGRDEILFNGNECVAYNVSNKPTVKVFIDKVKVEGDNLTIFYRNVYDNRQMETKPYGVTFMLVPTEGIRNLILNKIPKHTPTTQTVEEENKEFWEEVYWLVSRCANVSLTMQGKYILQVQYDGDDGCEMIRNETLKSLEVDTDTLSLAFDGNDAPYEALHDNCYRITCSSATKKAIVKEILDNL